MAFGRTFWSRGLERAIPTSLLLLLTGCATMSHDVSGRPDSPEALEQKVSAALLAGQPAVARQALAEALRTQPQNGYLHLLNGLSYQVEDHSLQSSALAKVGYDAAEKFAAGHFWAHYLAGALSLDLQEYPEAAEHFAKAIFSDPDRPQAFAGLAISGYFAGDLDVAHVAAQRAMALAPMDPVVLRTAAYVAAARGERGSLDAVLTRAEAIPVAARDLDLQKARLTQLLRTASLVPGRAGSGEPQAKKPAPPTPVAQPTTGAPEKPMTGPQETEPAKPGSTNQVMVEVTLLLNQASTTQNTGINLLDGLTVQFGLDVLSERRNFTGIPTSFSRVITSAIRIPQITYSLNLFNKKGDSYRVIARPSLVASLGEQSEFFIGRTVSVGVSGINIGIVQPIDIGTSVKVTPSEITPEHSKFKIEVVRSFVAQDSGGTFAQSLTTFKQTVQGTVDVEFGKTVILSGLYEAVDLGASSKTPVLGDAPIASLLFNARTRTERRDVALVLVTPRLVGSIETDTRQFRGETLNKLLSFWTDVIDPAANMDAIIGAMRTAHAALVLHQPRAVDLRLPPVTDPGTLRSVVQETVAQLPR